MAIIMIPPVIERIFVKTGNRIYFDIQWDGEMLIYEIASSHVESG